MGTAGGRWCSGPSPRPGSPQALCRCPPSSWSVNSSQPTPRRNKERPALAWGAPERCANKTSPTEPGHPQASLTSNFFFFSGYTERLAAS